MKKTLTIAALFATAAFASDEVITISDAYARASGMNAKAGAAFFMLDNASDHEIRITGATSDVAERVEIHTHKASDDGVMQMIEVEEGIVVPAQSCVLFERGGYHVMFMGIKEPFEQGKEIEVTLNFDAHDPMTLTIPVDLEHEEPEMRELPEGREACVSAKMEMMPKEGDSHEGH